MSEKKVSPNLCRALGKLEGKEFTLEDLPNDRGDPVWVNIQDEYQLSTMELSALKNHKMEAVQQQQPSSMIRFQSLLESKGITPSQPVIMQLVKHFASSVAIVSDVDIAAALYYSAARMPRLATELVLKDQGISVAQPFQAADPSKAILLHAFRDGYPMILKVSSSASVKHEAEVINGTMQTGDFDLSEKHLCPTEIIQFASAKIKLTDTNGPISTPLAGVRQGLLMKHYQTTLAQCKIPLTTNVLLKYGKQHKIAISHMHKMGYCHLDIKPANIFLLEGDCFLGDYGAATQIGLDISECTRTYYPTDFPHLAETKTDFLLLVKTLMEMFGAIQSPVVSMSTDEILQAVETVNDQSVKEFLHGCFGDDQAAHEVQQRWEPPTCLA